MNRNRLILVTCLLVAILGVALWVRRAKPPAGPGDSQTPTVSQPADRLPAGEAPSSPAPGSTATASAAVPAEFGADWIAAHRLRLAYAQEWGGPLPTGMAAFREWTSRYAVAPDVAARSALEPEGVALARARRPMMLALILADPQRALAVTVPMAVRQQLPASVLAELEQRVAGTGDLQTFCVLPVMGSGVPGSIRRQVDLAGTSYEVHLYGRREQQQTEFGASLHGIALDRQLALHESPVRLPEAGEAIAANEVASRCPVTGQPVAIAADTLLVAIHDQVWPLASAALLTELEQRLESAEALPGPTAPGISPDAPVPVPPMAEAAPTAWTTGAKQLLVIRVDFSDVVGAQMTQQAGLDLMNNNVSPYYDQASYGATSIVPAVTANVYRMPQTAAAYESGNLTSQLYTDATTAAGADYTISNYTHVMIVFRRVTGSNWGWAGLGNIGGGRTWINGYYDFRVTAHELGHNFGLYHANQWQVSDGNPASASGATVEYADPYDVMGGGSATSNHHFGPWFKNRLGWLPDSSVTRVSTSGTYRIARFDNQNTPTNQPLALSIYRDGVRTYWIGFRQNFTSNTSLFSGAFVQWGFNSNQQSQLLDMTTPGSSLSDAGLRIGSTFDDSAFGISVRPTVKGGTAPSEYLDIEVTLDPSANPRVIGWGSSQPATAPAGLTDVVALASGASHSLALKNDGTVVAWGSNASGQATVPAGLTGVASIAAGGGVSGAVKTDGTIVLWGDATNGVTTVPAGLSNVRQLAIGNNHALALRNDGTVVAWGSNAMGQSTVPASLSGVSAIAAGQSLSVALRATGTVQTWGANYGAPPAGLTGVTAIASGGYHVIALRSDGTVAAWGTNTSGECNVPAGLTGVVAVGSGYYHSLALKSDGTITAWGSNSSGQSTVPAGIPSVQRICGAGNQSLALTGVPSPSGSGAPEFTTQPLNVTVASGANATFTVAAAGSPAPTLQWQRRPAASTTWAALSNAGAYSGVTNATLTVSGTTTAMTGDQFRCVASNTSGSDAISNAAALTVTAPPPTISAQPSATTVVAGAGATLSVSASASGGSTLTYQWRRNGVDIAGATNASYTLLNAQAFDAGSYTVVVSSGGASVTSGAATLTVNAAPSSSARLLNLSTRAQCLTGSDALIPGFVISGSGTKRMLIRGVGPTLATFGLSGTLADPRITLMSGTTVVASNDDWGTNANLAQIATTFDAVQAFDLVDGSRDAVLLVDLPPGSYTVPTSGAGGGTGLAIVELYDADTAAPTANLINISNRGFVGVGGSIMIPGFVISSEGSRTVLIRAVGPTLGAAPFNVPGVLADPVLTVFNGSSTQILSNDDWGANPQSAQTASVAAAVNAFALQSGSLDAAFVVTLPPGVYTVQASGKSNTTGTALVEVYLVP